ncbi:MAG: hypothetical protein JXA66_03685 [Oligoflexia bacterium]|nr:hypothetical protein [Oligoflexia bacterium]
MKKILLLFSLILPMAVFAQGFYYNPVNKQFFSNKTATFSIRPVMNTKYLEKIEVSIDGSEFKTYSGKLKFDNESVHYVRFRAVDPVLNWSPIQTFKIYVDTTPPVSRVFWTGPAFTSEKKLYINKTSQLNVNAEDNLSGAARVEVKKDNSGKVTAFTAPLSFDKDGDYSIELSAVDNVGNTETWKSVNFTVDTKAPETSVDVKGLSRINGNRLYVGNSCQVILGGRDAAGCGIKRIEYRLNDGAVAEYKQPVSISSNMVKLAYRAIDNVDNSEDWKSLEVYLDSMPPEINIRESGSYFSVSGKLFVKEGFKLVASVSDKDSGVKEVQVFRNGKSVSAPEKLEFDFPGGESSFMLKALDYVNNISESNPYSIVVDNVPPVSEFKTSEQMVEREGVYLSGLPNKIDIKATDTGVGVDRIEFSYDGKSYETFTKNIDLASWESPQKKVYYRSVDRLGNVEKARSLVIKVLTNPPVVDLFVESEGVQDLPLSRIIEKGGVVPPAKAEGKK